MHIETYYSGLFTDAEELFVQIIPMPSKVTPNTGVTLASNIFLILDFMPSVQSYLIWRYRCHVNVEQWHKT